MFHKNINISYIYDMLISLRKVSGHVSGSNKYSCILQNASLPQWIYKQVLQYDKNDLIINFKRSFKILCIMFYLVYYASGLRYK